MHLSKKKKTFLAWTIPTATIVVSAAIVIPVVITLEDKSYEELINAKKYKPQSFDSFSEEQKENLLVDPSNFTWNFFQNNIVNSLEQMNSIFSFESYGLLKNEETSSWYDSKSGIVYQVLKGIDVISNYEQESNESLRTFNVTIRISKNGKWRDYKRVFTLETSSFAATEEEGKDKFIELKTKLIDNLSKENKILPSIVLEKQDSITSIDQITSVNDLKLDSSIPNFLLSKSKDDQENVVYKIINGEYKYNNSAIKLSVSSIEDKFVYSSTDAYRFVKEGDKSTKTFDLETPLFKALKDAYNSKKLLYLPSLTSEEQEGLSDDEKINKRIQKLIFSDSQGFAIEDVENSTPNKIPQSDKQAVVVKVSLGQGQNETYTYIVLWASLFKLNSNVVNNAQELDLIINKGPNGTLTYENLINPSTVEGFNEIYNGNKEIFWNRVITTKTIPQNNLIYKIIDVKFEDEYCKEAIIKIQVSHPEFADTKKEYTKVVSNGFFSKAYVEMEKEINKVLNVNGNNLSSLSPTLTLKQNVDVEALINKEMNESTINESFDIVLPNGINETKVKYKFKNAALIGSGWDTGGFKIIVTYSLCSPNDENNEWKEFGTVQEIETTVVLSKNNNLKVSNKS